MRLSQAVRNGHVRVGPGIKLVKVIGSGAFGQVYIGEDRQNEKVAVKMERIESGHSFTNTVRFEAAVLRALQGGRGVPKLIWKGTCSLNGVGDYNVMVTELLGPDLEDLFKYCGRKFSLKTTLMLADQMVSRVEHLHKNHFVHRDIKPDNFLMGGSGDKAKRTVYLVDFGLAKKYRDPRTHSHICYQDGRSVVGTTRYCSVNALRGVEQSRRDDLEALGYVFVYFLKGSLPWQGVQAVTHAQKAEKVREMKMSTPINVLCKDIPSEFASYLKYCRGLQFHETPDYKAIRENIFRRLFNKKLKLRCDWEYDWSKLVKKDDQRGTKRKDESSQHTSRNKIIRIV